MPLKIHISSQNASIFSYKAHCAIYLFLCIALSCFPSCSSQTPLPPSFSNTKTICGREPERIPLYQISFPHSWQIEIPSLEETLVDTRKPLCTLLIESNGGEKVRLTIHNFPADSLKERIPPQAQIARWKQQFSELKETAYQVEPLSFNGYQGLFFEGSGLIEGKETAILGWSLQLGKEHFQTLSHPKFPKQLRADVTIKASGPENLLKKYRAEIVHFAKTFSLINEIPRPR